MDMPFFEANLEAIGFRVNIELNKMIIFLKSMQMPFVEAILEAIEFKVNIQLKEMIIFLISRSSESKRGGSKGEGYSKNLG